MSGCLVRMRWSALSILKNGTVTQAFRGSSSFNSHGHNLSHVRTLSCCKYRIVLPEGEQWKSQWQDLKPLLNVPLLPTSSSVRCLSQNSRGSASGREPDKESDNAPAPSGGIMQRFKEAYKEYGKVLVAVHLATSAVWFGSFYYAAYSGIDVVPLLQKLGFGETVTATFAKAGVGEVAVAYLLYKLATPARYTVTIGGTQLCVRALRHYGYMAQVPENARIRNLYGDMKTGVKDKVMDRVDGVRERMDDVRGEVIDKVKDRVDGVREKYDDLRDDVKDKMKDRLDDMKDKVDGVRSRWKDTPPEDAAKNKGKDTAASNKEKNNSSIGNGSRS